MSDYNNKKKYKKQKAKDRARKAKQARRSRAVKEENRVKKAIEKIKWQSRTRIKPLRKVKDESGD